MLGQRSLVIGIPLDRGKLERVFGVLEDVPVERELVLAVVRGCFAEEGGEGWALVLLPDARV